MSCDNSDSEGSLSDWELVHQGDARENEPNVTDNEGNSSGSEFIYLDHTAVSYHHRPNSQDRDLAPEGRSNLDDLSHETLQTSSVHDENQEVQAEKPEDATSSYVSSMKEETAAPDDCLDDRKKEVSRSEVEPVVEDIPKSEHTDMADTQICTEASEDQSVDPVAPAADPLVAEGAEVDGPQSLSDGFSKAEEAPAHPKEAEAIDPPTECNRDSDESSEAIDPPTERNGDSDESSEPSEPELLSISDNKSTDSESEVEILVPTPDDTVDESMPALCQEAVAPLNSFQQEDQAEPGATFMAGAPHQYLQSLVLMGAAVSENATAAAARDVGDGGSEEQAEAKADEEDGIQVLEVEEKKEVESSDEDIGKISKENSVERDMMNTSGSSVSSRFSFIHRDRRSDDESLPESDISLINDDSDLSNQDQIEDQVTLFDPVRIRQYKHNPNTNLNTILSLVLGAVLALGIGIGIGHAFGTSRELLFRSRHDDDVYMQQGGEAERVRNLKQSLETCASKRADMESSMYEYQEGKLKTILNELQNRIGHLERENDLLKNAVQVKADYMERVSHENRALTLRVDDMRQNLTDLSDGLVSQKTMLEGRNTDERKSNAALRKNLTDYKMKLDELNMSKQLVEIDKNNEISDLQGRLITVGTELKDVKEQNKQLMQSQEILAVQLNDAKNNLDDLSRSKEEVEHHTASLLKDLKTRLNALMVENIDLKAEVSRLRYLQHPANPDQVTQFREKVNVLKTENEELQSAVSKSRYTQGSNEDQHSNVLLEENKLLEKRLKGLEENLQLEKNRSDMWQTLFLSERAQKNVSRDEKNFMDCMKVVFSHINVSEFTNILSVQNSQNLTRVFMEKVSFVLNTTKDMKISDYMKKKWGAFYNFTRSAEFKDGMKYAENGFENLQDVLMVKWKQFRNYTNSENFQKHINQTKDVISQMKETVDKTISKVQNFSNSDHVKEYINKTKETMSKLSIQIKETWTRLRNISSGLYESHAPKVREVQDDVTKSLFEFGKSIKERFGKFKDELHPKSKEGTKQTKECKGKACTNEHREEKQKTAEKTHEQEKHGEGMGTEHISKKEKKGKKCKKVTKKFKSLKYVVENLTKKQWYRIDNSDREEILEDFDEFNYQYLRLGWGVSCLSGDKDVVWLNCQISWWRASLSDSLDATLQHSCESSLARWQVKVTRKYLKAMRKRRKKGIQIVITPVTKTREGNKHKEEVKEAEIDKDENNSTLSFDSSKEEKTQGMKTEKGKADWLFKRAEDREDRRHDPKWYFRRMDDREDGRHNTKWLFNRAEDRANHHKNAHTCAEGDGTYGKTVRRGRDSGNEEPCQQTRKEKSPDNGAGEQDYFRDPHREDFHPGAPGFYDDEAWNDPSMWEGY